MQKFCARSTMIEAIQCTGGEPNREAIIAFAGDVASWRQKATATPAADHDDIGEVNVSLDDAASDPIGEIVITSEGGETVAAPGDWIVRDVGGRYFACPSETFSNLYIAV